MSITVRYFASLKESLGRDQDNLIYQNKMTVQQCWDLANPDYSLPDHTLSAVNMEYTSLDTVLCDQDEVAFFPPVTGG